MILALPPPSPRFFCRNQAWITGCTLPPANGAERVVQSARAMSLAGDQIRHVVVLMLESRSFDHLLGFYRPPGDQPFEGLRGTETVPLDPRRSPGNPVAVRKVPTEDVYVTPIAPGHSFRDVSLQLYGRDVVPPTAEPVNNGFVCSYGDQRDSLGNPVGHGVGVRIMNCVDPAQIPVLAHLASTYVVCDHWFSSMPGPTWPNRFFVHAATSGGHVADPMTADVIRSGLWKAPYRMRTIYESLMAHPRPRTWKIYFHDIAQALAFRQLHAHVDRFQFFHPAPGRPTSFLQDAARGTLPNYSFIEPQYVSAIATPANDQHPPHDLREGERLIAAVYDALRGNPDVWAHCLLVLLWDQHGGFYDHVPPPRTIDPDGVPSVDGAFRFTRLGVRVPAVLVSPWLPRGYVDQRVYDHTSLLATVRRLFGLEDFLTRRDACANAFDDRFLCEPRPPLDCPDNLTALVKATPAQDVDSRDLELTAPQRSLEALSAALAPIRNEHDGARRMARRINQFLQQDPDHSEAAWREEAAP